MFETFAQHFASSDTHAPAPWPEPRLMRADGYQDFAGRYAGCSFEGGLYRVHSEGSGPRGQQLVSEGFPRFASRAVPFAYDWLGRQFALDDARVQSGESLILMLEPGTGQALEIPLSFRAFHEQLNELREPALANRFFNEWRAANPEAPPLGANECVGYRVPLFLGGADVIDKLEVIDLGVYWALAGQLRQGTLHLRPGTTVKQASLNSR